LLAHGRWFSPASSTTKTGRHDIAEILLKVVLKHQKSKSCYTFRTARIKTIEKQKQLKD
jgi:ribosomal protein L29